VVLKEGVSLQVTIEKPRLGLPVSLIVDDPAPCINPFYYFRLQVDCEGWERHEQRIPLDFLAQFAGVCQSHGIRGKFSLLPYPAGLGSILEGLKGCDRGELAAWLDLARTEIAPRFDITPEILTHTLALDLRTRTLLPQPEHVWIAGRTLNELKEYFGAAMVILKDADFAPTGITQPCGFDGSRDDYAHAVLEAIRAIGGPPVTYYFVDGYFEPPPMPPPDVVLLDRARGVAVVSIIAYCDDYFWPTQRITGHRAEQVIDALITADGRGGRLGELAAADEWLLFVCHWQTLYSDSSREGLKALDEAAARLARAHGSRLIWLTLSEIARYRAAAEACRIDVRPSSEGWQIEVDSAFDCPDFTISLQVPEQISQRVAQVLWQATGAAPRILRHDSSADGLLTTDAWCQAASVVGFCFHLACGRQLLRVICQATDDGFNP
jgi:hypothetical protein